MNNVANKLVPGSIGLKYFDEHGPTGIQMETLHEAFGIADLDENDVDKLVLELEE